MVCAQQAALNTDPAGSMAATAALGADATNTTSQDTEAALNAEQLKTVSMALSKAFGAAAGVNTTLNSLNESE